MAQIGTFSTAALLPVRKIELRKDIAPDSLSPLDSDPANFADFNGYLIRTTNSPVRIAEMCSDAQAVRHTIAEATRTKAQIHFLHLQLEGESVNRQDQREARLLPGDIMLCDSSRPHEIVFEKPIHMLAFGFSDELMRHYVHNPQSISAVLIPGNKGIGGLLSEVLINVWRRRQNGSEFDVCLGPALEITLGIYLTQDQPLRFYSHFPHPRSQAFY